MMFSFGFVSGAVVACLVIAAITAVYRAKCAEADDLDFEKWQSEWMN